MKLILIVAWWVFFMVVTTIFFEMISMANTIANLVGAIALAIAVVISWKTECFTKIKFIKPRKK